MAARKRPGWGGARKGAGRKPTKNGARPNQVTVMLTDEQLATLRRLATEAGVPVGSLLYDWVKRRLR